MLKKLIEGLLAKTIRQELNKRLPPLIEEVMTERFTKFPDRPLNEVGFNWALAVALRSYWPEVSMPEAVRVLREYIGTPFGTAGYTWTAGAANEIAKCYVNEFGEK